MRSDQNMWQLLKLNVASWGDSSYDYYSPKPRVYQPYLSCNVLYPIIIMLPSSPCSRLVFASQARCHVHVLHASCGKCPTTPLLKHSTLLNNTIIEIWLLFTQTRCYQPYLPCNILHLIISTYFHNHQSMLAAMCHVSVQFVISQTRCHSSCPPYQLYEVSHHTCTSY